MELSLFMRLCQKESCKFWISTNIDHQGLKWFQFMDWLFDTYEAKQPSLEFCQTSPPSEQKSHVRCGLKSIAKWKCNDNLNTKIRNSTVIVIHASLTNLSAASGNMLLPWALKRRSWQSSVNWMLVFRSSEIKSSFLIGALMSFAVNGG